MHTYFRKVTKKETARWLYLAIIVFFVATYGQAQTFLVFKGDTVNCISKAGVKHGRWLTFRKDSTVKELGTYKQNLREGLWVLFWGNGNKKAEISYLKGDPYGRTSMYYSSGNLQETGIWRNNMWVGEYQFFHANGKPAYLWNYSSKGQREGEQQYFHENGNTYIKGTWTKGKKEGEVLTYYKSGAIKERAYFCNGKGMADSTKTFMEPAPLVPPKTVITNQDTVKNTKSKGNGILSGTHKVFNSRGLLFMEGKFVYGKLIDGQKFVYGPEKQLLRTEIYENGKRVKTIRENF